MANELQAEADTIKVCLMNYSSRILSLKMKKCVIQLGKYSLLIFRSIGEISARIQNTNI